MTPGGTARLLVRSCQALSAADLALSSFSSASDAAGGVAGGATDVGGVAFLSGGAEGDMTAALRKLHELGPSLSGRCVDVQKETRACRVSTWLVGTRRGGRRTYRFAFDRQNKMHLWVVVSCLVVFFFILSCFCSAMDGFLFLSSLPFCFRVGAARLPTLPSYS